jgi:subfamily B ATP-binding cassette protein MsbA
MIHFLRQLWEYVRQYRSRFFLGVITGIVGGIVEPMMVVVVVFVFAVIFPEASPATLGKFTGAMPSFMREWMQQAHDAVNHAGSPHQAAKYAMVALIPATVFLRSLFGYLNAYFLHWTAVRVVMDIRTRLFNHLLTLSAGFFARNPTGELISRISSDTAALQNILSNSVAVIFKDPVTVVGSIIWLLWFDWKLTLVALVALPLGMTPIAIVTRKVRKSSRAVQSEAADLMKVMTEAFTGHRVIKAYNLEQTVTEQFQKNTRAFIGHYMRIIRALEMPGPLLEFLGALGIGAVFLFLLAGSHATRDFGSLLTYIITIFTMYRPLKNLTRLHNQLNQASAASERVFQLLAEKNSVPEPDAPRMLHADKAEIVFENVDFSYGEKKVLQQINLTVKPGQMVALVGASGSGKTTLTNLLLRFFDPDHGSVKIGGVNLRDVRTCDLRNQIAVVSQENILFNDTIRRNIELGRLGASNDDIAAAAQHAHATEFIAQKPQGFDTVIGEKGVALSGGQRQRLAIARAVLKNAPVLVLDEATSALDTESERAVQEALDELMQGRTTICIAHRLSTILHADMIVVLDQGKIVETGRHDELVKRGGVYQKLYELQFAA